MKTYLFLLGILLAAVSFPASANYAINGQCFASAVDALDAFDAGYPRIVTFNSNASLYYTWLSVTSSSITGQNLTFVLKANSSNLAAVTVPVSNCTTPTVSAYDYANGGALWAFGFAFTLGIWFVSKNIGLVIDAVKRF